MAMRRPKKKKGLSPLVIGAAIGMAILIVIIVFATAPTSRDNPFENKEYQAATAQFYEKIKDPREFQKLNPALQEKIINDRKVPPEWGKGDFVPWYDPIKGKP